MKDIYRALPNSLFLCLDIVQIIQLFTAMPMHSAGSFPLEFTNVGEKTHNQGISPNSSLHW